MAPPEPRRGVLDLIRTPPDYSEIYKPLDRITLSEPDEKLEKLLHVCNLSASA